MAFRLGEEILVSVATSLLDEKWSDRFLVAQLPGLPGDMEEVRNRAAIYGVKLLGRLLGSIK